MTRIRKRLVILESPFSGDVENNIAYGRLCLLDSLRRGEAPIASHLLYTQPGVLDDAIEAERELGMEAGIAWLDTADASVVYTDFGISRGMQAGIDYAIQFNVPVEYRKILEP